MCRCRRIQFSDIYLERSENRKVNVRIFKLAARELWLLYELAGHQGGNKVRVHGQSHHL